MTGAPYLVINLRATFHGMLAGRAEAQETAPVTTMGWGGEWDDRIAAACYMPFTEKSGTPVQVIPYSTPKVLAMHEAGTMEVDVLLGAGLDTPMLIDKGVAAPIDWSVVDKDALTPNQLAYGDYAIGGSTLSYVMAYNTRRWPGDDHPKSWADFWDVEKFPGPRSLGRYPAVFAQEPAAAIPHRLGLVGRNLRHRAAPVRRMAAGPT
ncbi:hypothetical protein LA6_005714 (plasmid) [Paracoccaceae bacterium]|nr:hypothetical protein LA6_005714 [Paracoccaceae bacterium]